MTNEAVSAAKSIRRKLGRGLGSLIASPVQVHFPADSTAFGVHANGQPEAPRRSLDAADDRAGDSPAPDGFTVRSLPLERVRPNPKQPRQQFEEDGLRVLAESISSSGLMQPIVVRPETGHGDAAGGFQIIAGERRWRAAQIAGLRQIPAVIRDVDDRTAAELSLVENLQRQDLNPMERAGAFRRLIDDYGLTHQEIARQVGLDRTSITNHLRLHELDDFSKDALQRGRLSLGHAKALLAIANMKQRAALAEQAVRQDWSVRELERRVKRHDPGAAAAPAAQAPPRLLSGPAAHVADLERRLSEHLGTKVRILPGRQKGAGRMLIEFYTLDQFEGLMHRIQFEGD